MAVFRTLAFLLLFYGWTAVLCIAGLPLLFGAPRPILALCRFWVGTSLRLLRATVGIVHEVRGLDQLPDQPCIVAVKHQSAWETLAINLMIRDPAIVVKKELILLPVFGWYLWRARQITVDRAGGGAALKRLATQARQRLAEGRAIVIYPEGTRTPPGVRRVYHPGVAALYRTLGVPVVPVALNAGLFWPRRSLRWRPGTITVEFLPPIAAGRDRAAFVGELEARIENASERLRREALARDPALADGARTAPKAAVDNPVE